MKKMELVLCLVLGGIAVAPGFAAPAKLVDIQSSEKATVTGWVFVEGAGTRILRAIEVKFKINKKGNVELPILAAYLYDRDKNLVTKLTSFLVRRGASYENGDSKFFKGKKTQYVAFNYRNETKFKYFLVVMGVSGNVSYKLSPRGAKLQDFTYDEK